MKALTLWRPWSDAIVHGPKRVENRPWRPYPGTLGTLIAIHAGKKYDAGVWQKSSDGWKIPDGYTPPHEAQSPTGIVGVARVVGYLDRREEKHPQQSIDGLRRRSETTAYARLTSRVHHLDLDPWWLGPVGWLLEDVVALPKAIPYPGALGLWRVPPKIVDQIENGVLDSRG